jgi:hypothetical protein
MEADMNWGSLPRGSSFSLCTVLAMCGTTVAQESGPDFNRDVRPILSQFCFKCHGPDDGKREAGLRLDARDAAIAALESGTTAINPGKPYKSELLRRIETTDTDLVMPPASSNMTLSPAQKKTLREWIAAGANYAPHWAYVAPKPAPLPKVKQTTWPRNEIDVFILAQLEKEGLKPSPEADRYALIRRVSLDLLGIPPTVEEADAFVQDTDPAAYERLIDRLLASPQYGERWARRWLDLARYADTNGYEKDRMRSMWPYRDWVINAINADMPYDRFTIEQIAGDLLPHATQSQRIATGFHRNTMLNEEGGIDPLEYRFHAMTDRVATTGAVWLGLTVGCAQCHTHKYDPLYHTDYYGLMAFLNNADEPEMDVWTDSLRAERKRQEVEIAAREASLPERFPPSDEWKWLTPTLVSAESTHRAELKPQADGAILVSGNPSETDTYMIKVKSDGSPIGALRIEALTDPSLGNKGPGRTPHGNFVLTEVKVNVVKPNAPAVPIKLAAASADVAQDQFPAANAIDGQLKTGWAIHTSGEWNVNRTLIITFAEPITAPADTEWNITLDQQHGMHHTLGKFRLSLGQPDSPLPVEARRVQHRQEKFAAWEKDQSAKAVTWTPLRPLRWKTTLPKLELLDDGSMLSSGDLSKRDVYELTFGPELAGATAIRIEAIPDERLPKQGPGRVYYEGPFGDFFLSELELDAEAKPLSFANTAQTFASGNSTAAMALDKNPLTGWAINGGQGKPHVAVFALGDSVPMAKEYTLRMIFERYYAAGLGRFRISMTSDPKANTPTALPAEVEALLVKPIEQRTDKDMAALLMAFCRVAPELAGERAAIEELRKKLPLPPTSLVFQERPADNPREQHLYKRGEFLQPQQTVPAGVPSFLHNLPRGASANRLTFAQWLIDSRNPLVGRVTANRHWQAFFGRGLVRTMEDFGYQGELPTHPALLDWLALELPRQQWSIKELHRLIVTSATYRQSSTVTRDLLAKDAPNKLLARGPRSRLEAELVRDVVLSTCGLLSDKIGGPSVFPPQPANISTEGAYGQLAWNVSPGEDRYRRGLYTFAKRTAPYAMFTTFDAPSGEACLPRREVSNTPLQALTLLNDAVFLEAAQQLGREWATRSGTTSDNITALFRRCLTRPPRSDELSALVAFHEQQTKKFAADAALAKQLASHGDDSVAMRAAWTATARVLLNLDEMIGKE